MADSSAPAEKTDPDVIPFVGEITKFLETEAPADVRKAIAKAGRKDILSKSYPYDREMDGGE